MLNSLLLRAWSSGVLKLFVNSFCKCTQRKENNTSILEQVISLMIYRNTPMRFTKFFIETKTQEFHPITDLFFFLPISIFMISFKFQGLAIPTNLYGESVHPLLKHLQGFLIAKGLSAWNCVLKLVIYNKSTTGTCNARNIFFKSTTK